jgi:hypothetical protein
MSAEANVMLQMASADNYRLCKIVEAADALAKAIERHLRGDAWPDEVKAALDAFKVVRQGQ